MKSTGIVRRVDDLGRIVIPMELRRSLRIEVGDPIEIYAENSKIFLVPCKLQCVCCGNVDEDSLRVCQGVHVCPGCLAEFNKEGAAK